MKREVVAGTVRAIESGSYLVVRPDGTSLSVRFDGDIQPKLGSDVIGNVLHGENGSAMTLTKTLSEAILRGKAQIAAAGEEATTVRLMAATLRNTRSAAIKPGFGYCLERTPSSEDETTQWLLDRFSPVSDSLGVSLNIIDVQALARSSEDLSSLRDRILPADKEGSDGSLKDLKRLLRTGFNPQTSSVLLSENSYQKASINFIAPYSPFWTAWDYARVLSKSSRRSYFKVSFPLKDAQRFLAAQQVALAIEPYVRRKPLTPQSPAWRHHQANSFAFSLATLLYLCDGGAREHAQEFAALMQGSLLNRVQRNTLKILTRDLAECPHESITLSIAQHNSQSTMGDLLQTAFDISSSGLSKSAFAHAEVFPPASWLVEAKIALDDTTASLSDLTFEEQDMYEGSYRCRVEEVIDALDNNPHALARMDNFSVMNVPIGMDDIFDRTLASAAESAPRSDNEEALDEESSFELDIDDAVQSSFAPTP